MIVSACGIVAPAPNRSVRISRPRALREGGRHNCWRKTMSPIRKLTPCEIPKLWMMVSIGWPGTDFPPVQRSTDRYRLIYIREHLQVHEFDFRCPVWQKRV